MLATLYVAGIAVMFGILGTTFALLGKAFGTFLANPFVIVPLALFFFAMALSMFGAFDLTLPAGLQARLAAIGGAGYGGAFLMGIVGGLIAAPCTGPPLAGILAYVATTRDAFFGFFLLAMYAVGIGIPFWLIAGFSVQLPKSGPWMNSVKSIFGIALVAASLYYLKPVLPILGQLTSRSAWFLIGLSAAALVGLGLGAVHLEFSSKRHIIRKVIGIVLVTGSALSFTNYLLTPPADITWLDAESQAVEKARQEQRLLLVDFQADWCLPCKEFEVTVFSHPRVLPLLHNFVLLKIDVTQESAITEAWMKKYQVDTLPAVRLVSADGQILGKINQLVKPDDFVTFLTAGR